MLHGNCSLRIGAECAPVFFIEIYGFCTVLNTTFSPWPSFTVEEADPVRDVILSNRVNYWRGKSDAGLRMSSLLGLMVLSTRDGLSARSDMLVLGRSAKTRS